MDKELHDQLIRLATELGTLFPQRASFTMSVWDGDITVDYHGCKTLLDAERWFEQIGVPISSKTPYTGHGGTYTAVEGNSDGIKFTTYPGEVVAEPAKEGA